MEAPPTSKPLLDKLRQISKIRDLISPKHHLGNFMRLINIISILVILSLFSSPILADQLAAVRHQCFQAFQEGQKKGCPEKAADTVDTLPGVEEEYLTAAREKLRGSGLQVYSAKLLSQISLLVISTFVTTKIAGQFAPSGGDNAAAAGMGLLGASAVGTMISTQVQGMLNQITNPAAKYLFHPLIKEIASEMTTKEALVAIAQVHLVGLFSTHIAALGVGAVVLTNLAKNYGGQLVTDELASVIAWSPKEMLEARLLKFQAIAPTLPEDVRGALYDELSILRKTYATKEFEAENAVADAIAGASSDEKERIAALKGFEKVDRLMNIPRVEKPIVKEKYEAALKDVLKSYSPQIQESMESLASSIHRRSSGTCESCNPSRSIYYLMGATGTGKTYLVEQLGESLGLPVIILKLSKEHDEFALVGEPRTKWETDKPFGAFTKLLTSLSKDRNYSNAIIFFDEVDKALNGGYSSSYEKNINGVKSRSLLPFLLELFNSNPKPLRLHDLMVSVDISKFTFVLAGNAPVVTTTNEFMARMTTINFDGFDLGKRVDLACEKFGRDLAKYGSVAEDSSEIKTLSEILLADDERNLGVRPLIATLNAYRRHLEENRFEKNKKAFDWKPTFEVNSRNVDDILSKLALLKKNVQKKRESLPSDTHNHPFFLTLEDEIARFEGTELLRTFGGPEKERGGRKSLDRLLDMFKLPVGIKDLSLDPTLESRLNSLFDIYPEAVKSPVMQVLQTHIENSKGGYESNSEVSKNVLYFLGEPGTLKTSLVSEISKTMDLPVIELSLENYQPKSGRSGEDYDEDYSIFTTAFFSGSKSENYLENGIIFIDEVHKSLNSENSAMLAKIMKMIDASPTRKEFELDIKDADGNPIKIDLSRFLFILVGNDIVSDVNVNANVTVNSKKSAFGDRVNLVKFEKFSLENKRNIAKSMFKRELQGKKMNLQGADLETQLGFVEKFADFFHDKIGTDSFRGLEKVVKAYATQCRRSKDLSVPISRFDYEQLLIEKYAEE